jgi:hypothetical protein
LWHRKQVASERPFMLAGSGASEPWQERHFEFAVSE